jgi:hypothetical protein
MTIIEITNAMGGSGKKTLRVVVDAERMLAEFMRRGQAAQQAVDAIIAAERAKQKP